MNRNLALSRRQFLASGISATSLVATGMTLPGFLARSARAALPGTDERILVVVQLSGGNDGLNMVVPFADDLYHKARPTLRITPEQALKLDDRLGLHPEMSGLKGIFDRGRLAVVTNVGYPNPDRSHFRSMDIWHTAREIPEGVPDGWLGRVIDGRAAPADQPAALHLADESLPLALRARTQAVPSVRDIGAFRLGGSARELEPAISGPRPAGDLSPRVLDDLLFVQRVAVQGCRCAGRLEKIDHDAGRGVYPGSGLGERLRQISTLIAAGFGARIYYTSLGGFDTHARQELAHGPLLRELSDALAAFQNDLESRGFADRVVTMTFSEFGRRVKENGSFGTDHGAAAPMLVMGSACRPGIVGTPPNLARLLDGDVAHDTDFRGVYASLLDGWLGVDSTPILGARYAPTPVLA